MEFRTFDIAGPVEIIPRKFEDERGYFTEIFRASEFEAQVGRVDFVQENQSLSTRVGTIRGIHFQVAPYPQGKLVRCLKGSVFDVAVDLRRDSPTFAHWVATTLTADENNLLWIPVGFGHGFCTLEPDSVITYRVSGYYSAEHDKGVSWNDPQLGISWPHVADTQTLSAKDRTQPNLAELQHHFTMEGTSCAFS